MPSVHFRLIPCNTSPYHSIFAVVIHTPEKGLCGALLQLSSTINQVSKARKWSLKLEIAVRVTILKTVHLSFSPKNWWAIDHYIFNSSIFSSGNTSCFQMIYSQVADYCANECRKYTTIPHWGFCRVEKNFPRSFKKKSTLKLQMRILF